MPLNITSELKKAFNSVDKALTDACEPELKQPFPGKRLVMMTDTNFRRAGYAIMIEHKPDYKIQPKKNTYAPKAFELKLISPAQFRNRFTRKNSWQYTCHFMNLHTFCGKHPENRSVTLFFRQKPFQHLCGTHALKCCNFF